MKKLISYVLITTCLFTMTSCNEQDNRKFIYEDIGNNEISILNYDAKCRKIEIPEEINDKKVTRIGEKAFKNYSYLKSITLPYGVTSVGNEAFYGAKNLKEINMPSGIEYFGKDCFDECHNLREINIPTSIKYIDSDLFTHCYKLSTISVSSGNEYYDSRHDCNAIIETATKKLILGTNSTLIPSEVEIIGKDSFDFRSDLGKITLSKTIKKIEGNPFKYCTSLIDLKVLESNTTYDSRDNCLAVIESATDTLIIGTRRTIIPKTVKNIGKSAFEGQTGLQYIVIPSNVEFIDEAAFANCGEMEFYLEANEIPSKWNKNWCDSNAKIYTKSQWYINKKGNPEAY